MSAKDGKPCKKCGSNEWYANGKCAPCGKEYTLRWQRENPDKVNEKNRQWQRANPEKHAKKIRRQSKANPEKIAERGRRWKKANPEKVAAMFNRRRTAKTAAGGSYTEAEWNSLVEHYGNKCLCCGRDDVKLTVDHVIPVSKGGTSNIDNIQPLCGACNASKLNRVIDYRPSKGLGRWVQKKLFG